MSCKFKILWFDDESDWVDSKRHKIANILENYGLEMEISLFDGSTIWTSDKPWITNDYDLIFMDYKLTDNKTGLEIIQDIRSSKILTDILFYSSDYVGMIKKIVSVTPPLDGIYYEDRVDEKFMYKLEMLISKIIKRSETVENIRGIVLDSSAEFEKRINDLLLNIIDKDDPTIFSKIRYSVNEKISNKKIDYTNQCDSACCKLDLEICSRDKLKKVISNNAVFSHKNRLLVIDSIIPLISQGANTAPVNFYNRYIEEFGEYRNAFGHIKHDTKSIRIRDKDIIIDEKLFSRMRRTINRFDSEIAELEKMIL